MYVEDSLLLAHTPCSLEPHGTVNCQSITFCVFFMLRKVQKEKEISQRISVNGGVREVCAH